MRLFCALARVFLLPLRWLVGGWVWLASTVYGCVEWLYHLRVELWCVEGEEQHSRLPLKVLCGLHGATKNHLLKLIFGQHYRERSLGRYWLWNLFRAIPSAAADASMILLWTCDSHLKRLARPSDWFLLPDWVLGEVALPRDAIATRKVERDLRKIRARGLSCEVAHDRQAFEDFYHNMYFPYAIQTYGDCAYMTSYKQLRRLFRTSDLLLIKKDGNSIAGQFIIYNQPGPMLLVMGIRDANRAHIKDGASDAVYHFGLQYLEQKGFKEALVGWTRPFLRDGVLKFKRKWSQVIVRGLYWGRGLRVWSLTPAVKSFLRNNPFIFKRDGLLYAAVFAEAGQPLTPEDVQQMTKDYSYAGLAALEIYCLPGEDGAVAKPAGAELPEGVKLCPWPP